MRALAMRAAAAQEIRTVTCSEHLGRDRVWLPRVPGLAPPASEARKRCGVAPDPAPGGPPPPPSPALPPRGTPHSGRRALRASAFPRAQVRWAPVGTRPPRTSAIASCAAEPPLWKRRGRVRRAAPRGGRLRAPEMLPRVRPRGASAARGGPAGRHQGSARPELGAQLLRPAGSVASGPSSHAPLSTPSGDKTTRGFPPHSADPRAALPPDDNSGQRVMPCAAGGHLSKLRLVLRCTNSPSAHTAGGTHSRLLRLWMGKFKHKELR